MEENCETLLWKLIPTVFGDASEILTGPQIVGRLDQSGLTHLKKFKPTRVAAAISKLASSRYPRSPIESCRSTGRNGYRLRSAFDQEPPSSSMRGRPPGPIQRSQRTPHPKLNLSPLFNRAEKTETRIAAIEGGKEILLSVEGSGHRKVHLLITDNSLDAIEDLKSTFFKVLTPSQNGQRELIFLQTESPGDGIFTPFFSKVVTRFESSKDTGPIRTTDFLEVVEKELNALGSSTKYRLTEEEERGLIGELWFLAKVAIPFLDNAKAAVEAWHGPNGRPIDFWFDGGCVEVKTSLANAKTIHISNVQQLDTPGVKKLYLAHLKLVNHPGGKEAKSLPEYIQMVRKMLKDQPKGVRDLFEQRLSASQLDDKMGRKKYRDRDSRHYKDRFYVCADDEWPRYYLIQASNKISGFPRFTRDELERRGIEVEKYKVRIDRCGKTTHEDTVMHALFGKGLRK